MKLLFSICISRIFFTYCFFYFVSVSLWYFHPSAKVPCFIILPNSEKKYLFCYVLLFPKCALSLYLAVCSVFRIFFYAFTYADIWLEYMHVIMLFYHLYIVFHFILFSSHLVGVNLWDIILSLFWFHGY